MAAAFTCSHKDKHMNTLRLFGDIIVAAAVGGASCALVGFFLSHLRLPFMGVCLSHAALAGAVFANLFGLPVGPVAFFTAVFASFCVALAAERIRMDLNLAMGIIFSLMMGVAFIGIGLTPGPKTEALGLLWGSVLFVSVKQIYSMIIAALIAVAFILLFAKEIMAVLFSREIAAASGIRVALVYYMLLTVSGLVITTNLEAVGGLMLFSLLVSPPAAAFRITQRYWCCLACSAGLGACSALSGLYVSYVLNVPTGAAIVVAATGIFVIVVILQKVIRFGNETINE